MFEDGTAKPVTIAASTGSLNATSAPFNVNAAADYLFADGYEECRP